MLILAVLTSCDFLENEKYEKCFREKEKEYLYYGYKCGQAARMAKDDCS